MAHLTSAEFVDLAEGVRDAASARIWPSAIAAAGSSRMFAG